MLTESAYTVVSWKSQICANVVIPTADEPQSHEALEIPKVEQVLEDGLEQFDRQLEKLRHFDHGFELVSRCASCAMNKNQLEEEGVQLL